MARQKVAREQRERYYGEFEGRIEDVIKGLQDELAARGPDARLERDTEYDYCYCDEGCCGGHGYPVWYVVFR